MADRTGTRSSNRRNTPQIAPRSSQSPNQRTARTTRSQSRAIASSEPIEDVGRQRGEGARGSSVDSDRSEQNAYDDQGQNERLAVRARAIGDLSIVAEDPIVEYPELEVAEDEDEEAEADVDEGDGFGQIRETVSPGGQSNFSGTTALTTHSAQELADLDPFLIAEALEDLSESSAKVISVVVPTGPFASSPGVVAKELKIPGSRTAKRLARLEAAFKSHADYFGSETYINGPIILRALTGVRSADDLGDGPWRPDPLLYKANVTTFVTKILTTERESPDSSSIMEHLDGAFPTPFLAAPSTSFNSTGSKNLPQQTFHLALNIRTQLLIIMLSNYQSEANYDPDSILQQIFFEPGHAGRLKPWEMDFGDGFGILPKEFEKRVTDRLTEIRSCFPQSSQAMLAGDISDLEQLDAKFSWPDFLSEAVIWARLRLDEIELQIAGQGGVRQIVTSLSEEVGRRAAEGPGALEGNELLEKDDQPQIELEFEASAPTVESISSVGLVTEQSQALAPLLPAATLPEPSFATSSAISHLARRTKRRDLARLSGASSSNPIQLPSSGERNPLPRNGRTVPKLVPSTKSQSTPERVPRHAASLAASFKSPSAHMDQAPHSDGFGPSNMGDANEVPRSSQRIPLASQTDPKVLMDMVGPIAAERNKENRPQRQDLPRKRYFNEAQPTAQRLEFGTGLEDSQASQQAKPVAKGKRRANEVVEGEDDEDSDAFQEMDQLLHIESQKAAKPARTSRAPVVVPQSPPKRQRVETTLAAVEDLEIDNDSETEQAIRRAVSSRPTSTNTQTANEQAKTDYQKINSLAKRTVAANILPKVQSRRAWEPEAEQKFLEIIEEHGTSWSHIEKNLKEPLLAGRSQVNLKDKARNMHFDFLKYVFLLILDLWWW
ncbi:MAG: hypothetical protein M1812_005679 [Candelaria pacifica]|nr:MAG: hypothetical protein M1812_005679 [Candelaria pacifica]